MTDTQEFWAFTILVGALLVFVCEIKYQYYWRQWNSRQRRQVLTLVDKLKRDKR